MQVSAMVVLEGWLVSEPPKWSHLGDETQPQGVCICWGVRYLNPEGRFCSSFSA